MRKGIEGRHVGLKLTREKGMGFRAGGSGVAWPWSSRYRRVPERRKLDYACDGCYQAKRPRFSGHFVSSAI